MPFEKGSCHSERAVSSPSPSPTHQPALLGLAALAHPAALPAPHTQFLPSAGEMGGAVSPPLSQTRTSHPGPALDPLRARQFFLCQEATRQPGCPPLPVAGQRRRASSPVTWLRLEPPQGPLLSTSVPLQGLGPSGETQRNEPTGQSCNPGFASVPRKALKHLGWVLQST